MSNLNFIEIEEDVLKFWNESEIYQKAKEKNKEKQKFYFLDGPPYTSGKVHIGTAWNKALKDSILRYKRMKGLDVWDRAGYDMHGLPTENATQKKLGLKTKEDIQNFGIDKFIEECKQLCIDNMLVMNDDFKRLGVWMDFEGAYQSIKKAFMEGEWWLIKKAHENGRLYQGLRTMTWCSVTESALAKHELEYRTVTDDSIFVKFQLKDKPNDYLVIWTTTPWTIPFNLAVMVGPDIDYLKIKVENEYWYVAKALTNVFLSSVVEKKYEIVEELKGDAMEGMEYIHPFNDELKETYANIKKDSAKTHTVVLSAEHVDTTGGSGLVHCAPGCGPEDYEVGYKNGIPAYNEIDRKGVFPKSMGKFAGMTAKKDDKKFIEALDECGALIASTKIEHDYPHDERHHQPVIFRTTKQWFFKIEDIKEDMIKENNGVKWVPKAAYNAFDSWLKNLRDNSISKQRYWGTPIPIWKNVEDESDYIVVGSAKELEELSGQNPEDLHLSSVDKIEIKKDGKTYKRIPDILDVWVDAGSASWNCLDYPQNPNLLDKLFPADFILEGKDQIRGWFNLLHVASMISMKKPCFKNVYMHGFVQDSQGRKMSKSVGNYILPEEVIEKYGSETLRYYMISGTNPGLDINYNFEDMKVKLRQLGVLWNVHNFVIDMAKNLGKNPTEIKEPKLGTEEKYILSILNSTIKKQTEVYDGYRLNEAPTVADGLFLELSRTYIQFVRERIGNGTDEEKEAVLFTLYNVLLDNLKLFAPVCPMITEKIYLDMKKAFNLEIESIHLCEWPEVNESRIDTQLESDIKIIKSIIGSILNAREKVQLGVRWPIPEVIVETSDEATKDAVQKYDSIIKTQTNVKEISNKKLEILIRIKPNHKYIGPDFGANSKDIIERITNDEASVILDAIKKDNKYILKLHDQDFEIKEKHLSIERSVPEPYISSDFSKGSIFMNAKLTPELEGEGFTRELMRRVQSLRKNQGLNREDKINLYIGAEEHLQEAFNKHKEQIAEKVGAVEVDIVHKIPDIEIQNKEKVKGQEFVIGIKQV